ncbi:hypothetical protein LCGC14_1061700 [marine sediment metagenome]|uniref:Transcription regulator TrmB N-terminal domain-containing protein n=1 Tax=marine sediment metagenome TaxID=412755 RepID=A0A0F9Q3X0_9ZZZZ
MTVGFNNAVVYDTIYHFGPMTRTEMVKKNGIPRSTTYEALERLEFEGKIVRYKENRRIKVGRPKTFWKLKENGN